MASACPEAQDARRARSPKGCEHYASNKDGEGMEACVFLIKNRKNL
jgi:hypothetical protein